MKKKFIFLIFLPLMAVFAVSRVKLSSKQNYPSPTKNSECRGPQKLEDYSDGKEWLVMCEDSVKYGEIPVTDKRQIPDMFGHMENGKGVGVPDSYEAVVYGGKNSKSEFIAIFPVINPYVSYSRAGYIFQKRGNEYKLVFGRSFESLTGRWKGVRFDENGSLFEASVLKVDQDLGYLGGMGNRIYWSDYYVWDEAKNTYILANDKMTFRMDYIRKNYENQDLEACGNGKKISELYGSRNKDFHFCFDNSEAPFITNSDAALFLKAKKALSEISRGKNYSYDDVKNIELD